MESLAKEYQHAKLMTEEGKSFRTRYRRAVMGAENPSRAFPEGKYQAGGLPEIERPTATLVQEEILPQEPSNLRRNIAIGTGLAGAGLIGIPIAGLLAYKVIRAIGENVFGVKYEEEQKKSEIRIGRDEDRPLTQEEKDELHRQMKEEQKTSKMDVINKEGYEKFIKTWKREDYKLPSGNWKQSLENKTWEKDLKNILFHYIDDKELYPLMDFTMNEIGEPTFIVVQDEDKDRINKVIRRVWMDFNIDELPWGTGWLSVSGIQD